MLDYYQQTAYHPGPSDLCGFGKCVLPKRKKYLSLLSARAGSMPTYASVGCHHQPGGSRAIIGFPARTPCGMGVCLSPCRRGRPPCTAATRGGMPQQRWRGIGSTNCGAIAYQQKTTSQCPGQLEGLGARVLLEGNTAYLKPSASASLAQCVAFKANLLATTSTPFFAALEPARMTATNSHLLIASPRMWPKEMVLAEQARFMAVAGLARPPSIIARMLMHQSRRNGEPRAFLLLGSVLYGRSF